MEGIGQRLFRRIGVRTTGKALEQSLQPRHLLAQIAPIALQTAHIAPQRVKRGQDGCGECNASANDGDDLRAQTYSPVNLFTIYTFSP